MRIADMRSYRNSFQAVQQADKNEKDPPETGWLGEIRRNEFAVARYRRGRRGRKAKDEAASETS